ncbi:MAG: hypothetical protein AAF483_26915 [Planctomycetota bacterium]
MKISIQRSLPNSWQIVLTLSFLLLGILGSGGKLCAQGEDPFGGMGGSDPFGGAGGSDPFGGAGGSDPFGGSGGNAGDAGDNNPFGGGAAAGDGMNVFGGGAATPARSGASNNSDLLDKEEKDPVVRLLRASPPKTPQDMAEGITWMVRIARWDELGRLLDGIPAFNWNDTQKAELSRAVGFDQWIEMRSGVSQLSDAQKAAALQLMQLPAKLARDPSWIGNWVAELASDDIGKRQLAQIRLQDSGVPGIQALTNQLLDSGSTIDPEILAETIYSFGHAGMDALHAACAIRNSESAARATTALVALGDSEFSPELAAGLVNPQWSDQAREALVQKVAAKYGSVPTPEAVSNHLTKAFERQLVKYEQERARPVASVHLVWYPGVDGKTIVSADRTGELFELECLARLAFHRWMAGDSKSALSNASVLLQRDYQWKSSLHADFDASDVLPNCDLQDKAFWMDLFEVASTTQLHGATVRTIQAMPLDAGEESIGFLSDVVADSRPTIRFIALERLAKIDPTFAYRGSAKAIDAALEMTQLSNGPHSLVIGLQADLRQAAVDQLQAVTTAEVTSVNSAKDALMALYGDSPVEMVVICDRVLDQTLFELLQRLRHSRKAGALPIAVLISDLKPHEERLLGRLGGVVQSVLSTRPEQMQRVVAMMLSQLDTEPLGPIDRSEFAFQGQQFLSKITAERETYSFYNIAKVRTQLGRAVRRLQGPSAANMLSGLGTKDSQIQLVEMSAIGSDDARKGAAEAFSRSVQRFGNQLGREGVKRSYQLYNELGPQDPTAVKTLGFVLDVIEAQAGKRSWPQGL